MTVEELIAELRNFPKDTPVRLVIDGAACSIFSVEVEADDEHAAVAVLDGEGNR